MRSCLCSYSLKSWLRSCPKPYSGILLQDFTPETSLQRPRSKSSLQELAPSPRSKSSLKVLAQKDVLPPRKVIRNLLLNLLRAMSRCAQDVDLFQDGGFARFLVFAINRNLEVFQTRALKVCALNFTLKRPALPVFLLVLSMRNFGHRNFFDGSSKSLDSFSDSDHNIAVG